MKKIIFAFLLMTQILVSQDLVGTLNMNLDKVKNFIRIDDTDKKGSILILNKKDKIDLFRVDENFIILEHFEHLEDKKTDDYMRSSHSDGKLYTYWKKNNKTMEVHSIDFSTKTLQKNEIGYPVEKNEKFISSFNQNNLQYIVTVTKNTNIVNIQMLKGMNLERKMIDCYKLYFINSMNQRIKFWDYLNDDYGTVYKDKFKTIYLNENNHNSVYATEKKKLYVDEDKIIFSSDINEYYCQMVTISLKDFNESSQIISYDEEFSNQSSSKKTNSFILDDKVFIAKFSKNMFSIVVKSFENETLKTITINSISGQEYINSELIQEVSNIKNREVFKDKEKFFKKMYQKNPSITGYLDEGNYHLTIGGVSYPKQQSAVALGMFGLVGGIIGALISDSQNSSVVSYSDKDITYFKSVLKKDSFGTTKIENPKSNFDHLRLYIENKSNKENIIMLSYVNNHYYLLMNENKDDKISVYKF